MPNDSRALHSLHHHPGNRQKFIDLNHDLYVAGKQYCTENTYMGHQHNIFL